MSAKDENISNQLKQIEEAAKLAFENNDYFVQILDTIIAISLAQPLNDTRLQYQCLKFIYKSFVLKQIKSFDLRLQNSLKLTNILSRFLINDEVHINVNRINYHLIQKSIEIFTAVYDLMFLQLINYPDNKIWLKISNLKDFLISKWLTSYPLLPLNRDTDLNRSIGCKIALVKLIGKIIKTQLPPPQSAASMSNMTSEQNDSLDISILLVNKNHQFLYNSTLNTQGQFLIDYLINLLNSDSLLTPSLFSTIVTVLMALFKLRPNFVSNKFLNFILAYESQFKSPSKFESNKLKIRLNRRFNDRLDKILMSMLLNRGFIEKDPPLKSRFGNKLSYMVEKGIKQRKRGILSDENDKDDVENDEAQKIKRRKTENSSNNNKIDFYDESKIVKNETFKSLYTLINPKDELANFDISVIPKNILNNIVITGLSKVDSNKLNKGLTIISSRYMDLFNRFEFREREKSKELENNKQNSSNEKDISNEADEDVYDPTSNIPKNNIKDEEYNASTDDFDFELASKNFELPVPRILDPNEKKDQIKLIIDNFMKNSLTKFTIDNKISNRNMADKENIKNADSKLNKIAIPKWKNDSWIKVLARLATRGTKLNPEISNYIRETLFNYFKIDIKNKIDGTVEWLNEEYYDEFIVNKDENTSKENSVYIKYTGLILDYLIPFIEQNDRSIFIRLLSELPYLDLSLISKLRSICNDPVRFKLGFQPLLYLIMFRPPVFDYCIEFLTDLYNEAVEKNDQQLQNECINYLKKYKPDAIQPTKSD